MKSGGLLHPPSSILHFTCYITTNETAFSLHLFEERSQKIRMYKGQNNRNDTNTWMVANKIYKVHLNLNCLSSLVFVCRASCLVIVLNEMKWRREHKRRWSKQFCLPLQLSRNVYFLKRHKLITRLFVLINMFQAWVMDARAVIQLLPLLLTCDEQRHLKSSCCLLLYRLLTFGYELEQRWFFSSLPSLK